MADKNETTPMNFGNLNRFVKFENPGDTLEGVLLGHAEIPNPQAGREPMMQFAIYSDGDIVRINSTAQLSLLRVLPAGTRIRIEYRGKQKSANGHVNLFDVSVDQASIEAMVQNIIASPDRAKLLTPLPATGGDNDPFAP